LKELISLIWGSTTSAHKLVNLSYSKLTSAHRLLLSSP
jgi:hypothetical protein